MGYNKLKSEKYTNLGGINQKASQYVLGDREFIDLENLDFQNPGALSQRFGFTAAYAPSASFAIGASETINAIWQVRSPQTGVTLPVLNLFGFDSGVAAVSGTLQGSTFVSWVNGLTAGITASVWDHTEFQNVTYYSSGIGNFTSGSYKNVPGDTRSYYFGMNTPPNPTSGLTVTSTTAGSSFTGTYVYQYAYMDAAGFLGQLGGTFVYSTAGANTITISGFTITDPNYGPTAFILFRNRVDGFPSNDMISLGGVVPPATSYTDNFLNSQFNNQYEAYPQAGQTPTSYSPRYSILIGGLSSIDPLFNTWDVSEMYANRMWINFQSFKLAYSELENPQKFLDENVLTFANKSFRVIGLRNYNQSLMVLCQKGIFRLTGDAPENFNIVEMTTEYGCVSDKSIVVFNEKMWFLDFDSIVEFNGSNFQNVGNRVTGYLSRINKSRVYRRACGIHYPERNEVWFSIPIDGSEINNMTLVYDYLADGWTTFRGTKFKATALADMYFPDAATKQGAFAPANKDYYFGSIGGSMYRFGNQFQQDDGLGTTLSYTTKYHNELGKSQTAQFRRYYLDIGSYTGPTLTFGNEFFANYVTASAYYTVSMSFNQWQNRIDFGIPAKALSIKTSIGVTTGRLVINGYTIEFRFQRAV